MPCTKYPSMFHASPLIYPSFDSWVKLFCFQKLSQTVMQCLYTVVQEHPVWAAIDFWYYLFFRDVQSEMCRLYEGKHKEQGESSLSYAAVQYSGNINTKCLEIAASQVIGFFLILLDLFLKTLWILSADMRLEQSFGCSIVFCSWLHVVITKSFSTFSSALCFALSQTWYLKFCFCLFSSCIQFSELNKFFRSFETSFLKVRRRQMNLRWQKKVSSWVKSNTRLSSWSSYSSLWMKSKRIQT